MPRKPPRPADRASEVYYREHGTRADADLHDAIIAEGDHAAADTVSRNVMKRLGYDPHEIDDLIGSPIKPK